MKGHYEGDWQYAGRHGKGKYKTPIGTYAGEFVDNLKHGQGIMRWVGIMKYEGSYEKDLRHGHGSMREEDGKTCMGEYKDDMRHGKGIEIHPGKGKYEGDWS